MTQLDIQALHDEASRRSGLSDFGDPSYLVALREIIAAVAELPPNDELDRMVSRRIVHTLTGRLYSEHNWRLNPGYRDVKITAPVIITGMSRSGTSALHQLLAADEQFQWFPHWIAERPTVRTERALWPQDPSYRARMDELEEEHRRNPNMRTAHNIEIDLPEECQNVIRQSFVTATFTVTLQLPRYKAWYYAQDETASYRRYADNLRLIGLLENDRKPWLLKNPSHTGSMQGLLNVFPDARIIVTHRDPVEAVSSAASLTNIVSSGLWNAHDVGRNRLEIGLHNVTRMQEARDRHPDNFHDVDYRAFVADPMAVVQGVYHRFGLDLSPAAEAAMRQWIAKNPQGKFGRHVYKTEEYGLDPDDIRRRFADYIRRYRL
jgi:hypothetical protein